MKNIIFFLFALAWLAIITIVLVQLNSSSIPNINFKQDNIDLEFQYPMDWQIKVEGDLTDHTSDKYILLDNKIYNASITIHEYYRAQDDSNSECKKYNDCGLTTEDESFLFTKDEFKQINVKPPLFISNMGGTDLTWDSQSNAILSAIKPEINNSYHVYTLVNGKLQQPILLNETQGKYIEISYQFNTEESFKHFTELSKTLSLVINSLKR